MYKLFISEDDRKTIRYILTMYRVNSYKYASKLDLSRGVYREPISKVRVDELIKLFDLKGVKHV